MLAKIIFGKDLPFYNPNKDNLVAKVSTKKVIFHKSQSHLKQKTIIYIDCGGKKNMIRCLTKRGVNVLVVPWDFDLFNDNSLGHPEVNRFDGVVVSNGPGDPKMANKTIKIIKNVLAAKIPLLGICLGHQLLTLAAGGDTKKLKFGHRSQNQPCILAGTKRCYITTQNHGFAISEIPKGFKPWFINANDKSNEGIIHAKLPIMSVQFHPEASPGPTDTEWIFDYFLEKIK